MTFAVWFTGLPGSGKTVIAEKAAAILNQHNYHIKILQLDRIRKIITPDPAYSDEERNIVYASLAYMAYLLTESGINVFIDATANKQQYRDIARGLIPNFAEAYIECPLELCIEREVRRKNAYAPPDIYKKSTNKNATVPGVNLAYEAPRNPGIHLNSRENSIEECAKQAAGRIGELFATAQLRCAD
ncbi:MAG: putative adenylyl-sulfate kinase [Candidatus Argoarchaeum ethanivorans]|uniref:Putative adenylyl-sulfate kinase n=1 Tax=Candidatus Argoarchaeum ethanivorans TaxID=2608793 RepID=A0A811TF25_9EURY|nr:MAG: putative adenylyl-sulfate kinase [Candidatus Argoarchaeum ethanivorans]